jgi:hypothetical protein
LHRLSRSFDEQFGQYSPGSADFTPAPCPSSPEAFAVACIPFMTADNIPHTDSLQVQNSLHNPVGVPVQTGVPRVSPILRDVGFADLYAAITPPDPPQPVPSGSNTPP